MRLIVLLTLLMAAEGRTPTWSRPVSIKEIGNPCIHPVSNESGSLKRVEDCPAANYLDKNGRRDEIIIYGTYPRGGRLVCCLERMRLRSVENQPQAISLMSKDKCDEYCVLSENHINRGTESKSREFPHMAAIGYYNEETNMTTFDCGGSLISDKFVLSAAHCTNKNDRVPTIVRLGRTSLNVEDTRDTGIAHDFYIKTIYMAKEYSYLSKQHDIALFELEKPIIFTEEVCGYILPACLPKNRPSLGDYGLARTKFTVIGFGISSVNRTRSSWLMKGNVEEYPRELCAEKFPKTIFKTQICAHDPENGTDTCEGDSGSSLQAEFRGLFFIYGITSYGYQCGGEKRAPSVYTRVTSYIPWIENIVWPESFT